MLGLLRLCVTDDVWHLAVNCMSMLILQRDS